MDKSEYQTYLASREWARLREFVRQRSGGLCERCLKNPMQAVHHRTYERVGKERATDLIAICNPCHEFVSAKRQDDPRRPTEVLMCLFPLFERLCWLIETATDKTPESWFADQCREGKRIEQIVDAIIAKRERRKED